MIFKCEFLYKMNLKIKHKTTYSYSEKVILDPHHLYFYPIARNYFTLVDFELQVSPQCSGLAQRVDAEDNLFHQCWFHGELDHLIIDVTMEVETKEINPFNFVVEEAPKTIHNRALDIFLEQTHLSAPVVSWLDAQQAISTDNIITFLFFLCQEVHLKWDHQARYEEDLMTPDECFEKKKGSCRDLAWMMINMLRQKDIPARFVSGYAYNPDLGDGHELHAWAEAWVNGAGWIGLDPSAGLLTTEKYIPIVTSYHPANTFPVQGTFRGAADSSLAFEVSISEVNLKSVAEDR